MAIAILGGTFDPVHNAHLAMARAALEHLPVDEVVFIPTGTPPYRKPPIASAAHRLAMLDLAIRGDSRLRIDRRELAPGASGYTVDTLRSLRAELPQGTEIHFLMGADQYDKLDAWHRPDEVRRLAKIAVFARPGHGARDGVRTIPMQPLAVSASDIRARAAGGGDLAGLVPPAVADYIREHRLYR